MKYLLITNSEEACEHANLLVNEIQRFDIRAQIFVNTVNGDVESIEGDRSFAVKCKSIKTKHLKEHAFDALIVIGESFDKRLVRAANNLGIRSSFFQHTWSYSYGRLVNNQALQVFDKVFVDLPIYGTQDESVQSGHYLNDLIRKYDFDTDESSHLKVGLLVNEKRNVNKLFKLISKTPYQKHEVEWIVAGKEAPRVGAQMKSINNIRISNDKLELLKHANAVIVDSEIDSILAALLNCPQISISGRYGLFGFVKEKRPLLKEALREGLSKYFEPYEYEAIVNELDLILNDHEYCATMLTGYQKLKDVIGTQPVAREAARTMVEWLEDLMQL